MSPEQREKLKNPTSSKKDLSELESYLRKISIDDLMLFKKEPKSSKKLEGGPKVDGNQANSGQIRKGYSVPVEIATNLDKVYGASSRDRFVKGLLCEERAKRRYRNRRLALENTSRSQRQDK